MSNIDKQWLQQKIAEMEAARDEIPFGLDEDDSNTLAALRITLASLEAEPVGFIVRNKNTGQFGSWMHSKAEWFKDDGYEVLRAYTAPPVTVSVPDERPSLNNGIVGFDEGWNACRAAMLQGGKS